MACSRIQISLRQRNFRDNLSDIQGVTLLSGKVSSEVTFRSVGIDLLEITRA